jgi:hypothetical protein
LPNRHILGQTVRNLSPNLSAEPWCDWLPTEYVTPAGAALEKDYGANKPLVDVESDYYGYGLNKPYTVDDVRVEGWWFLLRGGAGFINLNGEYCRGRETGGVDTRERIVPQKKVLREFMNSLDLVGMSQSDDFTGVPSDAFAAAIAEPGKQYAFYLFHGANDGKWGAHFVAKPGAYRDTVILKAAPPGTYSLEWIDPVTGVVKRTQKVRWSGGDLKLTTPEFAVDVALRALVARE